MELNDLMYEYNSVHASGRLNAFKIKGLTTPVKQPRKNMNRGAHILKVGFTNAYIFGYSNNGPRCVRQQSVGTGGRYYIRYGRA